MTASTDHERVSPVAVLTRFIRHAIIAVAIILPLYVVLGPSTYSRQDIPLTGPCSAIKRVAPDDTYYRLALSMLYPRVGGWSSWNPTQEAVDARIARLNAERTDFLPTISDACLRSHASGWLDYYEREAKEAVSRAKERDRSIAVYDRKREQEADQERALAGHLGVRR